MTDQQTPLKGKAAAQARWRTDLQAWEDSYRQAAIAYLNSLAGTIEHVKDSDDQAAKHLMAAVELHTPDDATRSGMNCAGCSGCCDSVEWPCQTFIHLAAGLGVPELAAQGEGPKFADYWTDPYVTVTLAHFTKVTVVGDPKPKFYNAGATVTVTLAEAIRLRDRLMVTSMHRVAALR